MYAGLCLRRNNRGAGVLHGRSCSESPPARKSTPSSAIPAKTLRHSRKNLLRHSRKNTPPFPRKPTPSFREGGNPPHHPSFPRRRESTIPAHAGIQRPITPTPKKNTPPFPRKHSAIPAKTLRHSRENGKKPTRHPSFPRRRESTIPAHAGIQRPITPTPKKNTPPFPQKPTPPFPQKHSAIPAKTGLRHSREGGNPQFPRTREFNVPLPQHPKKTLRHSRKNTPPFPRKHSVIPAKAGIHNSRACGNSTSHYPNTQKKHSAIPLRHSRKAGIHTHYPNTQKKHSAIPAKTYSAIPAKTYSVRRPTFPRTREFNVPLPQHPKKNTPPFPRKPPPSAIRENTPSFPRRRESTPSPVIPAKAGIHNSRACGNSTSHYPNTQKKHSAISAKTYSVPRSHAPTWECGPASPAATIPKQPTGSHAGAWEPEKFPPSRE